MTDIIAKWSTSQRRLDGFMELELKMYPISLRWFRDNVSQYKTLMEKFAEKESYEQATLMRDVSEGSDDKYRAYYNINKLGGNPLLVERKERYNIDDIFIICHKTDYSLKEALDYCTEDMIMKDQVRAAISQVLHQ